MNPELRQAIQAVLGAADELKLGAVLVGALASQLAAAEEPDLGPTRGTLDADFALDLGDWAQFELLKGKLVARGLEADSQIEHRLYLGKSMVDLIPYGPRITRDGELCWPVSQKIMGVVGFEEACAQTVESAVDATLAVRRIRIAGFALLKIMAFLDRRASGHLKHRGDADDLLFWFRHYAGGKEEPRRYGLAVDEGVAAVDFLEAGAALLGLDVAALASDAADLRVRTFLEQSSEPFSPFLNALISPAFDEDREGVLRLCRAFRKGYEAGRGRRRRP